MHFKLKVEKLFSLQIHKFFIQSWKSKMKDEIFVIKCLLG